MKKLILLPTKNKSSIIKEDDGELVLNTPVDLKTNHSTYQELYVIDTEAEIVEGNWCISRGFGLVHVRGGWNNTLKIADKIVATTNSELGLPLINKEFIQLFVEKQGKVSEVDVEFSFEEDTTKDYIIGKGQPAIKFAVVTPKESDDVEKLYTKDEVSLLIKDFIQFYTNRPEGSKKLSGVGQWLIDHNLQDK